MIVIASKSAAHRRVSTPDALALDRASVREIDQDGHLHVSRTPISKANVCPYLGSEIPGWRDLGLNPYKIYQLWRDPEELEKAALTFNGKPLLFDHKPLNAEDHPHMQTVGAVTSVEWDPPYLYGRLDVWSGPAIDAIRSGDHEQLSAAYRYDPVMTPGKTPQNVPYDGRMTNIVANHVALVEEGRAGPDVVVGDAAIQYSREVFAMSKIALSRKAVATMGALGAYLAPKLAADAKIDLAPLLQGITAKNFKVRKAGIAADIALAVSGKLARDASIESGDLQKVLDIMEMIEPSADPAASDDDMDDGAEDAEWSDDDEAKYQAMCKRRKAPAEDGEPDDKPKAQEEEKDEPSPFAKKAKDKTAKDKTAKDEEPDDKDKKVSKPAMDAAIAAAVKMATDAASRRQREIREAERAVRPYVGDLAMAHDSAEAVYRTAFGAMGLEAKIRGVHPSALKAILELQPVPGARKASEPAVAMDSAGVKGFAERYPAAARIGHI